MVKNLILLAPLRELDVDEDEQIFRVATLIIPMNPEVWARSTSCLDLRVMSI